MKKWIATLLLLTLFFVTARADGLADPDAGLSDDVAALPAEADCRAALLMEYDSGKTVFELNAHTPYPMASVTKIMTLVLVFEEIENGLLTLTDKVQISKEAADMTGSEAFLDYGAQYSVSDLLKTVIIASANDSAVALAECVAGSEEAFVQKMNARAKEMGLKNTCFADCTGLAESGHYSSAYDIALMSRVLLTKSDYFRYSSTWMDELVHPSGRVTGLTNTNKLVRFYKGADGVKTGYTSKAMHCISASAVRNGMRFVAVVLGAPTSEKRFEIAKGLLNHGFASFTRVKLYAKGSEVQNELVFDGANAGHYRTVLAEDLYAVLSKEQSGAEPFVSLQWKTELKAPLAKGSVVGELICSLDGRELARGSVVLDEDVLRADYAECFRTVLRYWLKR